MSERINVYVCEYGCHTVTVDVDKGVTPMLIPCQRRSTPERPIAPSCLGKDGKCSGQATSCGYPSGPMPEHIGKPTHEWYKPRGTKGLSKEEKWHVKMGGLLLREIRR